MAGGNFSGGGDRQQPRDASAEGELVLSEEETRLPWLDDHDDDEDEQGVDTMRILIFALGALGVLLVVLGVVWWTMRDAPSGKLLPQGSVIAAEPGPYKTRPERPGGIEFAGTGDSAFRVAEGQVPKGRIAEFAPVPTAPVPEKADAAVPADALAKQEAAQGAAVQVGAYATKAAADAGWVALINRFEILQGRRHRIVQGVVDGSIVYRLQVGAANLSDADSFCTSFKAAGGDCQVKH